MPSYLRITRDGETRDVALPLAIERDPEATEAFYADPPNDAWAAGVPVPAPALPPDSPTEEPTP